MSACSIKNREKSIRENAFEREKKKLGLRFDSGLVHLILLFRKIILVLFFQINFVCKKVKLLLLQGCAIGVGFCAGTNLDVVLNKLEQVSKTEMTKKSSGILSFMKVISLASITSYWLIADTLIMFYY